MIRWGATAAAIAVVISSCGPGEGNEPQSAGGGSDIRLERQEVAPGPSTLRLSFISPEGYRFNNLAPSSVELSSSDPAVVALGESSLEWRSEDANVTVPVPAVLNDGDAMITLAVILYYCTYQEDELCLVHQSQLKVPIRVSLNSRVGEIGVRFELPPN